MTNKISHDCFSTRLRNMFKQKKVFAKISQKLAWVLCGGDLSAPTLVSEQYLLDLEREAFLSLCGEKKTLERIQSILTGGKILRN